MSTLSPWTNCTICGKRIALAARFVHAQYCDVPLPGYVASAMVAEETAIARRVLASVTVAQHRPVVDPRIRSARFWHRFWLWERFLCGPRDPYAAYRGTINDQALRAVLDNDMTKAAYIRKSSI